MSTIYAHASDCTCCDCSGIDPMDDDDPGDSVPHNYDQPHAVTHESKIIHDRRDIRRIPVTAYLCVYEVSRHYGGPEEGGWYYDALNFLGAAFPFCAEQDYEFADDGTWIPVGLPHVVNEPTRVRLESAHCHFVSIYGLPGSGHRYSAAQREPDFEFVYELQPGASGERPRPRYE